MLQGNKPPLSRLEDLLTEVAAATSRLIARSGTVGPYIDVELDLWHALRARLQRRPLPGSLEGPAPH